MTTASARAVERAFSPVRTILMAGASAGLLVVLTSPAHATPDCADGTSGDDTCIITLNNTGDEDVDAGSNTAAGDTLQFGGAADFTFDVGRLGVSTGLENFENYQKIDANTVTLTGSATVLTNWNALAGTLLVEGTTGTGVGNIMDGSSVTIAAGATFGLIGAGGANETIGNLSGVAGSFVTLGGTGTLTSITSTNSTFAGIMSGTGNFTKAGTATLILSGDNSYTGTTSVIGGVLEIAHVGAIDNSTAINIGTGGQLTGTVDYLINAPVTNAGRLAGNVTINGDLANSGGLLPGHTANAPGTTTPNPGQSMGTITVNGNYTASGSAAFVGMFVDLDAALPANGTPGTTHDFLDITGNVSGTPTLLFLAEFDDGVDTGAPTTGNGILVINVGGTTTPGAFVQGNALTAGAYQYLLTYVENYSGALDGYFLQSAVRDEMFAHPAALSASQAMVRHCFRDDQRVPDSPKGATYGRAWFGYHKGASNFGADTGIDMDLDFSCSTGGMDWRLGYGWFGGVAGGFGSGNIDLTVPSGFATMDGDARVIEVYAAYTSSSFFINLSAGFADLDWAFSGALLQTNPTNVSGLIASAQAGFALDLDLVAVKLFGALNYDDTNCGEDCFNFAVTEDTGLVEAKGTVRFDGVASGGSIRPWASVSFSDVLSDGTNTVSAGAVSVTSDTNQQLLSLDAGLQAYLDENFALFADGGYHESLSKDISGYKAGAGLKLYW